MADPERAPGTVTEVLQEGYLHHDQLLRPRMVGVAKGGDGPPPEDSDLARILQFGEAGERTSQRPGRVGQGANHVVAGALQPTSCTIRSAGSENMGQRM